MSKAYICGMSGRFPKSNNLQELWENLVGGVDMLGPTRWPPGLYGLPPRSGSIPGLNRFDAEYFGFSEEEALNSNLLLRVLLEVIHEGIVDSGLKLSALRACRTGLYLACTFSDADVLTTSSLTETTQINLKSALIQRVLSWYKFEGPVMSVDTACSSSLAALQMAVTDLTMGRCKYAVVTGINLIVSPNCSQCFNQLSMLSSTGDSHVFDISANGYVRSDGAGVVILTRNSESCARIYATIADIAVNCDGRKEEGIVFPGRETQCSLLRSIYGDKLIPPSCLSYVEAHGTGTQAGDRTELNALMDALCEDREEPLLVGSVKSNIGHCEAAAGLAGLIKCILSVHHGVIPPNLHYKTPNEGIEGIPLGKIRIVDSSEPLKGRINVIGVNSFGFGGVNGHVVIMSYKNPMDDANDCGSFLVPLTLRSEAGVDRMKHFLEKNVDNIALLNLISNSMLASDPRLSIRAYAMVHVPQKQSVRQFVTYTVTVTTGEKLGSGTDANVFIDLKGNLGKSGRIQLKESLSNRNKWERGQTDEFHIETKDIGQLQAITIGHDNKGAAAAWFLDHVTVHSPLLNHTWRVNCGRWLAKNEDDGLTVRELSPLDDSRIQEKTRVTIHCGTIQSDAVKPVWLLLNDILWCDHLPEAGLLELKEFRNSVLASDKILQSISAGICVEDSIKSGQPLQIGSKLGLLSATVCALGLLDVLAASNVQPDGYIGSGLSEIVVGYLDKCLTRKQCLQVALAVGEVLESLDSETNDYTSYWIGLHPELSHKLGPKSRILAHVSDNRILAALPTKHKGNILRMLQQTGGVYTEVKTKLTVYRQLPDGADRRLENKLRNIIPAPLKRSDKYRSCSLDNPADTERLFEPAYISRLLQKTVNQFQAVSSLPRESSLLSVCLSGDCTENEVNTTACEIPEVHCHANRRSVLHTLGQAHIIGMRINVSHLYGPPLPVDCTTPPLSPLVVWKHNTEWPLPDWCQFSARVKDVRREVYQISMQDVDGSVYDPLSLLLFHAWSAISDTPDKLKAVVLQNFTTNPELMSHDCLHGAQIFVHRGKQTFAVLTYGGIVMTGSYDMPEEGIELPLVPSYDVDINENVSKLQDDCETDVDTQEVLWEDSWLDFINATLEFVNPSSQNLPIKMMVDPQKHLKITHDCASVLVMIEECTGICKAGSLLLQFPPILKPSVDQSILLQNVTDPHTTCLVDTVLLYSLPRNTGGEDKLIVYSGCDENQSVEKLGFVSINNDRLKHKNYPIPDTWQKSDVEGALPIVIATHIINEVAMLKPGESVLVLPPLDTVSMYLITMVAERGCRVFTSTWDTEVSVMLENAFPGVTILHPKHLLYTLRQQTQGQGVNVLIKTDGSDMDKNLELLTRHGRCIQMGKPSTKDQIGMGSFLRNITVTTLNTASVLRHALELPDGDISAALEALASPKIRNRCDDGYPEPRGLDYTVDEHVNFTRPISLQNLFTMLDGPGFKAKDVLDGFPNTDVAAIEKLQEKLAVKPQEYSLAQNDLSYMCDSKEQFNIARLSPYMEIPRVGTPFPFATKSGYLAPPNTRDSRIFSVDMSDYKSASTPIIRVTVAPAQPRRDPLASLDMKLSGICLESSYAEDRVFSSPAPSKHLAPPKTTDLLFRSSPRTSLTPGSPSVKRLLTPTKLTPVLVKLNTATQGQPIFIVHPITGTLVMLKTLGQKLQVPCFGIQRTTYTPTSSISAIAGFYRNAIELQEPRGPYTLAGYSYGGVIAFEIARQLQKAGKEVRYLLILDGGPGFVHSQIASGLLQLNKSNSISDDSAIEIVALMSFIEMYEPHKPKDCIRGVLESLPTRQQRVRLAVDFLMGNVIVSRSPCKTKWLSLKERVLHKNAPSSEGKMGLTSVVDEVIRLSREKKADEYINSTRLADKYRPTDKFTGDIYLLRIKSDPTTCISVPADYGLGQLCSGQVKITYLEGDHQSFLKSDSVQLVADHIHQVLSNGQQ